MREWKMGPAVTCAMLAMVSLFADDASEMVSESGEQPETVVFGEVSKASSSQKLVSPRRELEQRVDAYEQKTHLSSTINPFGRYQTQHGANLYVVAEALYWKAEEDGLEYAVFSRTPTNFTAMGGLLVPNTTNIPGKTTVKQVKFNWDPGCRVQLGYNFASSGWGLNLNWTHLDTNSNHNQKSINRANASLFAFQVPGFERAAEPTSAKAKWGLHYNTLDWELGRAVLTLNSLSFRGYAGVRMDKIDQHFKVEYANIFAQTRSRNIAPAFNFFWSKMNVDNTQETKGIGLKTGVDGRWAFTSCWSVFGDVAGSIVWNYFNIHLKQTYTRATTGQQTLYYDVRDQFHRLIGNLETVIGLRWDRYFSDRRYHLGFMVGWEQSLWFNLNQMGVEEIPRKSSYLRARGNLGLSGMTFGAQLDF